MPTIQTVTQVYRPSLAPTAEQMAAHPLMAQVVAEVQVQREANAQAAAIQRMDDDRRLHLEKQEILRRHAEAVADYEAHRAVMHETLGRIWSLAQRYARMNSGQLPAGFHDAVFMRIDIPTLIPATDPYQWDSPMSTTRSAVDGYRATMGQEWPRVER